MVPRLRLAMLVGNVFRQMLSAMRWQCSIKENEKRAGRCGGTDGGQVVMDMKMTCFEHIAMCSWKREFDLEITAVHGGPPASDEGWANVDEDIKGRHREYARAALEVWKRPDPAHRWYGELADAVLCEMEAKL